MKWTSSARISAATRARRCSKFSIRNRTTRSRITISTLSTIFRRFSLSPLSNVLHTIPPALQDRLEILRLSGYTEREKLEIAKRHLVPKQAEGNGLKPEQFDFTDEGLLEIIRHYTREAGVRNLEREIGSCCRKLARRFVSETVADGFQRRRLTLSACARCSVRSSFVSKALRLKAKSVWRPDWPGPKSAAKFCKLKRLSPKAAAA